MATAQQTKILFLSSGGTISMLRDSRQALVPPKDANDFRDACQPIIKAAENSGMKIDFEAITEKDSSNMTPRDWSKLIFRVKKAQDEEGYDAVGIVHGTDTLSYTAAALAFGLHGTNPKQSGLRIPVGITGAQIPMGESGSDGERNLEDLFRTMDKASKARIADILVVFNYKVFLGPRILKWSAQNFDAFRSPSYPNVGLIDADGVHLDKSLVRRRDDAADKLTIAARFAEGSQVIFDVIPCFNPDWILNSIKGGASAVILKSTSEGGYIRSVDRLIPTIQTATREYGVPVFVTAADYSIGASYSISANAEKAGAILTFDTTYVAAYVKANWLMGNAMARTTDEFRVAMRTNYAGEVTPPAAD